MTPEDREKAIRAVQAIPLPFTVEFGNGREQDLVACLHLGGAGVVVDAVLAALSPAEPVQGDCPGCGAPAGYPPAGPCENHGTKRAVATNEAKRATEPKPVQEGEKCPDDGTCHHGCAEHYNGACWRVFNAEPLSVAGWGEKWPPRIKAAMQSRLTSLTGERHISVEDVL